MQLAVMCGVVWLSMLFLEVAVKKPVTRMCYLCDGLLTTPASVAIVNLSRYVPYLGRKSAHVNSVLRACKVAPGTMTY